MTLSFFSMYQRNKHFVFPVVLVLFFIRPVFILMENVFQTSQVTYVLNRVAFSFYPNIAIERIFHCIA